MIVKEKYRTREDGVELFKTDSDNEHKVINKRTGYIYSDAIDINEDEEYEEAEEDVELEGASAYEEVLETMKKVEMEKEQTTKKINYLNLTDNEALSVKNLYPRWEDKIGRTIEKGYITLYDDNLWKARQTHVAQEVFPPSLNTASLYEVIVKSHEGTKDDPIPFSVPMEIFNGNYYTQDSVLYLCIRDSGIALTHNLKDLVGVYVHVAS